MKKCQIRFINYFLVTVLWLLTAASLPAVGQNAEPGAVRILEEVQKHYEQSIENIADYVVVTNQHTAYYQKQWDNDRPYFTSRIDSDGSQEMQIVGSSSSAGLFSPELYNRLKDEAQYVGRQVFGDFRVHILSIDEIDGMFKGSSGEGMPDRMEDIKLYIDADKWVFRQIDFSTEAEVEGGRKVNINVVTEFKDLREVEGMTMPYETISTISGLSDMLSEEQRRQAREGLQALESRLSQMPPQQRQMVEQMMSEQLAQYREILTGGQMEIVQRIKEVKVNTGLTDGE